MFFKEQHLIENITNNTRYNSSVFRFVESFKIESIVSESSTLINDNRNI